MGGGKGERDQEGVLRGGKIRRERDREAERERREEGIEEKGGCARGGRDMLHGRGGRVQTQWAVGWGWGEVVD